MSIFWNAVIPLFVIPIHENYTHELEGDQNESRLTNIVTWLSSYRLQAILMFYVQLTRPMTYT